jgi:hypothetical protein
MAQPSVLSSFGNGLTLNSVGSYHPLPGLTSLVAPASNLSFGAGNAGKPAAKAAAAPSGGGGGGAVIDPYAQYGGQAAYNNNVGQYDQGIGQVNAAIGNLPGQQQSANSKIESSYQDALATLLGAKNQANTAYTGNKTQTAKDYIGAKNTIGASAGNTLNGLLRLLGSRGAGGSSAALITAPGAVTRQATQQRSDVGNTFGANNQSLDTNWHNYLEGYGNQVKSAGKQREEQISGNQDAFNSQKATLLQQLAQLSGQKAAYTGGNAAAASQPYLNQANSLLSTVGKFNYTPVGYETQAYNAPDLGKYTFNSATPTVQGQSPTNDYVSPYLAALLGKKQQTVAA